MPDLNRMMDLPCAFYRCLCTFPAQAVYLPGTSDFRIRSTESIVFRLHVVAGAPKSLSILATRHQYGLRGHKLMWTAFYQEESVIVGILGLSARRQRLTGQHLQAIGKRGIDR